MTTKIRFMDRLITETEAKEIVARLTAEKSSLARKCRNPECKARFDMVKVELAMLEEGFKNPVEEIEEIKEEVMVKTEKKDMAELLKGRRRDYERVIRVDGKRKYSSYDNGDEVAQQLRDKTAEEIYLWASQLTDTPVNVLKDRYGHLNAGQVRMNLGNRIRAAIRKKEKAEVKARAEELKQKSEDHAE